jgi:hypothetical protein
MRSLSAAAIIILSLGSTDFGFSVRTALTSILQCWWRWHVLCMGHEVSALHCESTCSSLRGVLLLAFCIKATSFENTQVLCCDWNKYDNFSVATGAVDRRCPFIVYIFSRIHCACFQHQGMGFAYACKTSCSGSICILYFKNEAQTAQLLGHRYGLKRLRWSAHAANHLLSCSYDTSVIASSKARFASFNFLPD